MTAITEKPVIAVTGSNGKSTTMLMTSFILECHGLKTAVLDNKKGGTAFTKLFERAKLDGSACLLLEAPVNALRQQSLPVQDFNSVALLNLANGQLSGAGGKNNPSIISSFLDKLPANARIVLNADNPDVISLVQENRNLITYALDYENAMVIAANVQYQGLFSSFDLTVKNEFTCLNGQVIMPGSCPVRLPAAGGHNISNALAAAVLSLLMGVDLAGIAHALARFPGVRRNLEVIDDSRALIIDDAAQNAAAIRAALAAAGSLGKRRLLILHGLCGGSGEEQNRSNALELAERLRMNREDLLFVTQSMYHSRSRHRVRIREEKAFFIALKEKNTVFAYYPDLPDALESALYSTEEDDILLLLGGPVLNKAAGILQQILGRQRDFTSILPGEILPMEQNTHSQGVTANPT